MHEDKVEINNNDGILPYALLGKLSDGMAKWMERRCSQQG
jgi:hypothetical protein